MRILTFIFRFIPLKILHLFGRMMGVFAYFFLTEYRKRTLSNLSLAKDLALEKKALKKMALKSFQNLAINALEYAKFHRMKNPSRYIVCENPEVAEKIHSEGRGIIFFCGHQANWETLFLEGTFRMKGVAIGKSIRNKKLYNWVLGMRQQYGGIIISQVKAIRGSLKALKEGAFLGIVGDQGMPSSNYSYPYFGRRAFTSTAPALLSYKTGAPIIVATCKREWGKYKIRYSDPLYPDQSQPLPCETKRLMDESLNILEKSIRQNPADWLWQHNRYKQQTPKNLYKEYRKDSILIIISDAPEMFDALEQFRRIYPTNFLFLLKPKKTLIPNLNFEEVYSYENQEVFLKDYRFKLVFNLTPIPVKKHYLKLAASHVLNVRDLKKRAPEKTHLSAIIQAAICRPDAKI